MAGAIVNIFFPSFGQLIQGRVFSFMLFFFLTVLGYLCFIVPGVVMHILSILDCALWENRERRRAAKREEKRHKEFVSALANRTGTSTETK